MPFNATLDVSILCLPQPHPRIPLGYPGAVVAPRISSRALRHIRNRWPIFSPALLNVRRKDFTVTLRSAALGFLDPLCGLATRTLGIFFKPQRPWASLFRAFFLPGDRWSLSKSPFRSCNYESNRNDPIHLLQRFAPAGKAVVHRLKIFRPRRDALLSWAFWPLGYLSPSCFRKKHLPFSFPLSPLWPASASRHLRSLGPQGYRRTGLAFPLYSRDADPFGLFHPLSFAGF